MEKATEYLDESLQQSKAFKMRYLTLQNYIVRGMVLRELGDYTKAEGNLFRALTAFTKQGNRSSLCGILLQIAQRFCDGAVAGETTPAVSRSWSFSRSPTPRQRCRPVSCSLVVAN